MDDNAIGSRSFPPRIYKNNNAPMDGAFLILGLKEKARKIKSSMMGSFGRRRHKPEMH